MRGNSRSSPTECAALCTAVCRVSAKVVRFGRPSACTNVLRNHSEPFLWRFLQAAGLPPFGTKRWRQKCPQGTSVGIGRRCSLSGHKRLRCFARPLRALEPPFDLIPPPVQCRRMLCASRNDDYSVASVPGRPSARPIALLPLLFAVLDLLVLLDQAKSTRKTEKGENFPIDSSGRIPRFRRCIRRPFFFPLFRNAERLCASRNHDFDSFYSVLAGLRPAGSHCENSGSSDGTGASARSGCAKQRSLLCPLSERGCRHPLLFAVLDLLVLLDQAKSTEKK